MTTPTLTYRSTICVGELGVNECTIHRAGDSAGARWWLLWFRVERETDGKEADFCVPVNPNGSYVAEGPGGKTWGLARSGTPNEWNECAWQVSPSINVLGDLGAHPGEHPGDAVERGPSQWHQTPMLIEVPESEAWVSLPP